MISVAPSSTAKLSEVPDTVNATGEWTHSRLIQMMVMAMMMIMMIMMMMMMVMMMMMCVGPEYADKHDDLQS